MILNSECLSSVEVVAFEIDLKNNLRSFAGGQESLVGDGGKNHLRRVLYSCHRIQAGSQ